MGAREKSVTTHFTTTHIRGKGRGKFLGYPTINMEVPSGFDLPDGIYAAWVTIGRTRYGGALHWGPIPTFKEETKSLEVFVLDSNLELVDTSRVTVDIINKIRDVIQFATVDALTAQIAIDVAAIKGVLQTQKIRV